VTLKLNLEAVTPDNYDAALELRVLPEQEKFVAPIMKSLADCAVYPEAELRVAREGEGEGEGLVGYVMIFPFLREGENLVNVVRLMIDERHQGRGLGRVLLNTTLNRIPEFSPAVERVRISTHPDNAVALSLYQSVGFVRADIEDGEVALHRTPERSQ
jgi:diamine N-acetyltransferase